MGALYTPLMGACHIGRGKVSLSTAILSGTGNCQSGFRYVSLFCFVSEYALENASHLDLPMGIVVARLCFYFEA
jgi:hypothetical protein